MKESVLVIIMLTVLATQAVFAREEMGRITISPPKPRTMMARSGSNVTLSCRASHPWFLCLWVHPSGDKLCSIQEDGEHSQVCQGLEGAELLSGDSDCHVQLENVSEEDAGDWLCLLSQEGVYHTDRAVTTLRVARPARPVLDTPAQLFHTETVNVNCLTDNTEHPRPDFSWALLDSDGQETVRLNTTNSSLTFTPRLADHGRSLVCYTRQLDPFTLEELYLHNSSVILSVMARPSPLQALLADQQDVVAGVIISSCLIIFCVVLVIVFTVRSTKSNLPAKSSDMMCGQESYIIFISEDQVTTESTQDKESGIDVSHGDFVSFSSSDLYSNTTATNNRSSSLTSQKTQSEADHDQSIDESGGSEGGLSNTSVFDCQHGCFGHEHGQHLQLPQHHHHESLHYLKDNVLNTDL